MIIEQVLVTNMAVFCYLVVDEKTKSGVLIDPAGDFSRIFEAVDRHGAEIKYVINTHGHPDHTSGNDHVMKKTGAPLLIHGNDLKFLGKEAAVKAVTFSGADKSATAVLTLKDKDRISFGSTQLWVIHTPGHSEGGICLYGNGNLFTGDTLFTEGMGRTDFPGGSMKVLMDSIRNKILSLPDDTVIWPGHHYGRKPKSTVREQKGFYLK